MAVECTGRNLIAAAVAVVRRGEDCDDIPVLGRIPPLSLVPGTPQGDSTGALSNKDKTAARWRPRRHGAGRSAVPTPFRARRGKRCDTGSVMHGCSMLRIPEVLWQTSVICKNSGFCRLYTYLPLSSRVSFSADDLNLRASLLSTFFVAWCQSLLAKCLLLLLNVQVFSRLCSEVFKGLPEMHLCQIGQQMSVVA